MQIRTLKTLRKISQVQSFAVAAQELNMTVSAVSMQMKNLERQLNVVLFDRNFRPPLLTPLGRQIMRNVETIVREEGRLHSMCAAKGTLAGDFELGLITTANVRLLPGLLQSVARHTSSANFRFSTGLSRELTDKVASGRLDAAIVTMTGKEDNLQFDTLLTDQLVYGIPNDVWSNSMHIEELRIPFLHFSPQSGVGEVIADTVREISIQAQECIVMDNVEAIVECVKRGIGYTLLPQPDLLRYIDNSVAMVSPAMPATRKIVLVTRNDSISDAYRVVLVDLLTGKKLGNGN